MLPVTFWMVRGGNGNWWSLFVVTSDGIILADPISPDFAQWLKAQLAERFPGKNHADDGTVVYFPAERVVFSTDFPADALVGASMRSLPSACGAFDEHPMSEWIKSYRTIEALDFDILAQGHGSVLFKKSDVTEGREYFEYLRDQVSAGMAAGKSLDDLRDTLMLEKYKDWAFYARLRVMNIEAAYHNLSTYK